ncbi:hypothetical protein GN958_ATG05967 [Phytophthora infestans]|uniref:Uncharacterized protein n=1 Tax=Phytophthora infestans TaxID=4787 RepID=A0A8S9V0Q3_PHYIN|nr:hypothetical protein GN958_ATG05967 [Phytophthora infestans]
MAFPDLSRKVGPELSLFSTPKEKRAPASFVILVTSIRTMKRACWSWNVRRMKKKVMQLKNYLTVSSWKWLQ